MPGPKPSAGGAAGDLAGAVICLFAHQLLSLDQLGLIRLVPGRTGRQYLQVVRDRELVELAGSDPSAVRGCLLRAKATDDTGVRVGLESRLVIPGTRPVAGSGSAHDELPRNNPTDGLPGRALCSRLAFGGCAQGPDDSYGTSRGTSLNGTSVFAAMLRSDGHEVRSGDPAERRAGGVGRRDRSFRPLPRSA